MHHPPPPCEQPMTKSRHAKLSFVTAVVLLAASAAFGQSSRYEAALVDYEIGHFDRAFAVFASLADEGHCDAARLAQQMARYGRPLYATDFKVAPDRLARWQLLPACRVAGGDTQRHAP